MKNSKVIYKTKYNALTYIVLFLMINSLTLFLLFFLKSYIATLIIFILSIFISYFASLYSARIIFYEDHLIIFTPTNFFNKNEKISYEFLISLKQNGFYQRGDISILFYKNKKKKKRYISSSVFAKNQYEVIEEIFKEIMKERRIAQMSVVCWNKDN